MLRAIKWRSLNLWKCWKGSHLVFTVLIIIHFTQSKVIEAAPNERRLLNDLLRDYNVLERPVANESDPLIVSFGITLQQIIDMDEKNQLLISNIWLNLDEKNQMLISNVWLKFEWVDANLRWNVSDYGGITDLRIPPNRIWKPDILMYNSADEEFDSTFQTNVVVRNNGSCLYVPPGIFKSMCKIDITWFPFDDQKCQMKFGSWTYGGFSLDLRLATEDGGDLSSYITNGEWQLLEVPGVRNSLSYTCCPEPYIDITYTIHLRRRTLYYGFNLIIPCMVISSMTLLGFTLPPESGEKISLGVTILLSMSVFMLQLTETLPPTSDAVSIIGTYFACIMVMVACSVIMTVIVINLHHRSAETCDMPPWVKVVVLTWLPIILRMSRPKAEDKESTSEGSGAGSPEAPCSPGSRKGHSSMGGVGGISSINGQLKDYADHQRHLASHKEIMANVLDLDDDYLQLHNLRGPSTPGDCNCYMNTLPLPQVCQRHGHTGPHGPHGHTFNTPVGSHLSSSFLAPPGGINVKDTIIDHPPPGWANSGDSPRLDNLNLDPCALDSTAGHTCQIVREISSCLRELKYITNRMRDNDDLEKIVQDWKFAAAIIDRLCFYAFTAFTIISTFVCLSSAPQLIV